MKIVAPRLTSTDGLKDLYRRATKVLVTAEARKLYPSVDDALCTELFEPPPPPFRRNDMKPHLLLVGPFKDDPELVGVDIYAGIGFIEVRKIEGTHYSCGLRAIAGGGQKERIAYLKTAIDFYNEGRHQ